MCWKINFGENPEKYHKVAEEDIIVFKFGFFNKEKSFFNPYFMLDTVYIPNVRSKEIELTIKQNRLFLYLYIEEGYHSYSGDCKYFNKKVYDNVKINKYNKAYYDNRYIETFHLPASHLGEFIIPKGTEYYEKENGEIVSSQLIWTGRYQDNVMSVMPAMIGLRKMPEIVRLKDIELCVGV